MRLSDLVPERPQGTLEFVVKKRRIRKKLRPIAEPSPALKALQLRAKELFEQKAGAVSISPVKNLLAHREHTHFFQTDLKDAFPSIKTKRLAGVVCRLVFKAEDYEDVVAFLGRYCMLSYEGNLAQGGPLSPLLFDLYCRWYLDRPIRGLLSVPKGEPGYVLYTRYVDDLTFSSKEKLGLRLREKLKKIIREAGFHIQDSKTTLREKGRQKIAITGGRLLLKRPAALAKEFYASLERDVNLFLQGKLDDDRVSNLRGGIAWYDSLESKLLGVRSNRQLRRLGPRVERARPLLKKMRRDRRKFPKEWLDQLRMRVGIIPYIRSQLPQYTWAPKASGIRCPCPFCHARGQTFTASPAQNSFYCHKCKRHGDVIAFARLLHAWDFTTAAKQLAKLGDLELPDAYLRTQPKQLSLF